jgi:hypothetical protein
MYPVNFTQTLSARMAEHRVHLLETELEVAFTFLDAAKRTRVHQIRERNVNAARNAQNEVHRRLKCGLICTDPQRASIESSLATLEKRLKEQTQASS